MSNRGFHQTCEAFSNEIRANQNRVVSTINSPHEEFLQVWWGKFCEAYRSRFPDDAVLTADFDKVAQPVENIVANNALHQSNAADHTEPNTSNVMPVMSSPHLMASSPVMESIGLQFPETGKKGVVLPFASNSGYQMQQIPTAPPKWNVRDDRPGINLGGHMLMELSIHIPANALPASLKLSDSGNNRSTEQASHQGWPSVGGIKRKTPLSSLASVWKKATDTGVAKKKTIICYSRGDVGLVSACSSICPRTKEFAKPACNQDNTFKEISNLDRTASRLLCCHFNSKGELLATGGDDGKV